MAIWRDGIENHEAYQSLTQAEATLQGTADPADEDERAVVHRARTVVSAIRAALSSFDSNLIAEDLITELTPSANQIRDSSREYQATGDATHLNPMNSELDEILRGLGLGAFVRPEVVEALRNSMTRYRQSAGQLVSNLEEEVASARERVTTLEQAVAEVRGSVATQAEAVQENLEEDLSGFVAQVAQLQKDITNEQARIGAVIEATEAEYATADSSRAQAMDAQLSEWRKQHEAALTDANSNHERLRQTTEKAATATLAKLNEQEEAARKVVSTVGSIAVSGGFGEYAAQERKVADFWRIAAAFALVVAGIPGLLLYINVVLGVSGTPPTIERAVERTVVGAPFLLLAGYAAAQSRTHRMNERRSRLYELELSAIDPFLALLPLKMQQTVKGNVAERYFGRIDPLSKPQTGVAVARLTDTLDRPE